MPKYKTIEIDGRWYRVSAKTGRPSKVPLTRASNTLTEAEVSAKVLSALRRVTKFWPPKMQKIQEGRRPNQSENKRLKWENNCEQCHGWFPESEIEVDHIVNCGGISGPDWMDKIKPWLMRALVEIEGYQRLCLSCHKIKTLKERGGQL